MKIKDFIIAALLILLIMELVSNYFILESKEEIITMQDSTIRNRTASDSVFLKESMKYSQVITKYVQDTVFNFGGKKISASHLINELYIAQDSISKTMNAFGDLQYELMNSRHEYYSCLRSQGWVQNDLDQAILARDMYMDSTSYYKNLIKELEKHK